MRLKEYDDEEEDPDEGDLQEATDEELSEAMKGDSTLRGIMAEQQELAINNPLLDEEAEQILQKRQDSREQVVSLEPGIDYTKAANNPLLEEDYKQTSDEDDQEEVN